MYPRRVVILGDSKVGKTTLIKVLYEVAHPINSVPTFSSNYQPTTTYEMYPISLECKTNQYANILFFDTPGNASLHNVSYDPNTSIFHSTQLYITFFIIIVSQQSPQESARKWRQHIIKMRNNLLPEHPCLVLISKQKNKITGTQPYDSEQFKYRIVSFQIERNEIHAAFRELVALGEPKVNKFDGYGVYKKGITSQRNGSCLIM